MPPFESPSNATCVSHALYETAVDAHALRLAAIDEAAATAIACAALVASLGVAAYGYRLLRPTLALAAFCVGGVAALHVAYEYLELSDTEACDSTLIATAACAVVAALIALSVLKLVIALLGAVAGAAVVVVGFDTCGAACDRPLWRDAPEVFERQLVPFWTACCVAALLGGLAARRQHRRVLVALTAITGGWGATWTTQVLVAVRGGSLPHWAQATVFLLVFAGGCLWQERQARRAGESLAQRELRSKTASRSSSPGVRQ